MPEVAKKKRIFQIAKELNISHLEIIQFLESHGSPVASHMEPVTPEVYLLRIQVEFHHKLQRLKAPYDYLLVFRGFQETALFPNGKYLIPWQPGIFVFS